MKSIIDELKTETKNLKCELYNSLTRFTSPDFDALEFKDYFLFDLDRVMKYDKNYYLFAFLVVDNFDPDEWMTYDL